MSSPFHVCISFHFCCFRIQWHLWAGASPYTPADNTLIGTQSITGHKTNHSHPRSRSGNCSSVTKLMARHQEYSTVILNKSALCAKALHHKSWAKAVFPSTVSENNKQECYGLVKFTGTLGRRSVIRDEKCILFRRLRLILAESGNLEGYICVDFDSHKWKRSLAHVWLY